MQWGLYHTVKYTNEKAFSAINFICSHVKYHKYISLICIFRKTNISHWLKIIFEVSNYTKKCDFSSKLNQWLISWEEFNLVIYSYDKCSHFRNLISKSIAVIFYQWMKFTIMYNLCTLVIKGHYDYIYSHFLQANIILTEIGLSKSQFCLWNKK